jgi:ssDNA thymidine ADP-ribosyltransferase, DarT
MTFTPDGEASRHDSSPKIYHITHIDNIPSIITGMGLVSDVQRIASDLSCSLVGMSPSSSAASKKLQLLVIPAPPSANTDPFTSARAPS